MMIISWQSPEAQMEKGIANTESAGFDTQQLFDDKPNHLVIKTNSYPHIEEEQIKQLLSNLPNNIEIIELDIDLYHDLHFLKNTIRHLPSSIHTLILKNLNIPGLVDTKPLVDTFMLLKGTNLQCLDLSNNCFAQNVPDKLFSNNLLETLWQNLPQTLVSLHLNQVELKQAYSIFNFFHPQPSHHPLKVLSLDNNQLGNFEPYLLKALLERIIYHFPKIERLSLKNNNLVEINCSDIFTHIMLPLQPLKALNHIDLKHNGFEDFQSRAIINGFLGWTIECIPTPQPTMLSPQHQKIIEQYLANLKQEATNQSSFWSYAKRKNRKTEIFEKFLQDAKTQPILDLIEQLKKHPNYALLCKGQSSRAKEILDTIETETKLMEINPSVRKIDDCKVLNNYTP